MRTIEKGKSVMLFVGGKAIALATSSELNSTANTDEVSTKDDAGSGNYEVIGFDWTITTDSLVGMTETTAKDLTYDELMALHLAGAKLDVVYGRTATDNSDTTEVPENGWAVPTSAGYKGKALIDSIKRTDANKQKSTLSISLKGCSKLTLVTA